MNILNYKTSIKIIELCSQYADGSYTQTDIENYIKSCFYGYLNSGKTVISLPNLYIKKTKNGMPVMAALERITMHNDAERFQREYINNDVWC